MKRKWIILLIFILLAFAGYKYIYQDHRNIQNEEVQFEVSSSSIAEEFALNTLSAEKKYLDKTIIISGIISELNLNDLTLDGKIFCQFSNLNNETINIETKIKVKGRFIGYDDLLEQVKLDQCIVINK